MSGKLQAVSSKSCQLIDFQLITHLLAYRLTLIACRFARLSLCVLILTVCSFLTAQNPRAELELRRQKLLQQIEIAQKQLNQTAQNRAAALDRLEILQGQIENRESLINNLHEEISETDQIIERTEGAIVALEADRARLRTEYGAMLRRAYKMKMPSNAIVALLSAKNFGESYRRWQYFRQYDKFRKRQARLIAETQHSLEMKNQTLAQQKVQKTSLVGVHENQKVSLTSEKKQKDALAADLKAEENKLKGSLKDAQKQSVKLNSTIDRLISDEIATRRRANEERAHRNREEAERLTKLKLEKQKTKPINDAKQTVGNVSKAENTEGSKPSATTLKPTKIITDSPENLALSSDFRSNKGKLPPPASGAIVRTFGKQKVLDKVTAVNNGIDIRTAEGADVHVVFSGTVSIVSGIAGLGTVVLVQHGTYYSVYSNLSTVFVKKGDAVSTRQTIGKAGINPVTNDAEVHFEVWLEKTQLNPSVWLAK